MGVARRLLGPSARAVAVLAVTQLVGWGTTWALPAVLADAISRDIHVPPSVIFAGVSMMLLVNAAAAPVAGPWIDRLGARRVLVAGSCIIAVGLLLLGVCQGATSYLLAWGVLGLGMATALSTPAFAALVEISGRGARRQIATLTLFTGLSSTVFWPTMLWLQGFLDWRSMVWMFAFLHLVLCLPLHAFLLPQHGGPAIAPATGEPTPRVEPALLPPDAERRAFWLVTTAFAASGFVGWGLSVQLPGLFKSLGLVPATAISMAALAGPIQVAARALDMAVGSRVSALSSAILASALLPLGLIVLAVVAGLSTQPHITALTGMFVFIFAWGIANGLMTVARAAVPLEIFDPSTFGRAMGRLAVMQNIAFAVAPVVMAAALNRLGPLGALLIAAMFALFALAAMIVLARLVKTARISGTD